MKSEWWILRCPKCGHYQVKEICSKTNNLVYTDRSLNCMGCGVSTIIKSKTKYGLNMLNKGPYNHPDIATAVIKEIKKQAGEKDERSEFHSYKIM